MKHLFKLLSLGVLAVSFSTLALANTTKNTIGWQDLRPEPVEVESPFKGLSSQQIIWLDSITRYETEKSHPNMTPSDALTAKAEEARQQLDAQKIDYNSIFEKRRQNAFQRQSATFLPNPKVEGLNGRIPGFVVPVEMDGLKVIQFYLVPIAGQCIHTPPPPPNQIVLIDYPQGFELEDLMKPVWVEGELSIGQTKQEIHIVDGNTQVESVYKMEALTIVNY
ncbi:DUF3299 domain-containing protein [Vibrio superstes]|uniref:DUF3299 domain-containing protein n=1 Tax=Vibrio superstes NBRC 103154 TaxID=1219062 RepID=A0A511QT92_9VIBR|nr:DUF3299 domain-containing protein [Vibrio superstes]GEM80564.1 hypothetical protein VSU01S_28090 [Vibrio superstes NBRC 103154]